MRYSLKQFAFSNNSTTKERLALQLPEKPSVEFVYKYTKHKQ